MGGREHVPAPVRPRLVRARPPRRTGRGARPGPLGAKLLGLPGPIAHGMWLKARCLAALEEALPDAYSVDVRFKAPAPLPSTVALSADADRFAVHAVRDGRPHLVGTVGATSP